VSFSLFFVVIAERDIMSLTFGFPCGAWPATCDQSSSRIIKFGASGFRFPSIGLSDSFVQSDNEWLDAIGSRTGLAGLMELVSPPDIY
jgi:hypothetical protein